MLTELKKKLTSEPKKTIVYPEGPDKRILEAASRIQAEGLMNMILIGNVDEVKASAAEGGFDISECTIIDPATYVGMDEMVEKMVELRKGKMTAEQCKKALMGGNYLGTMLVKMGKADGLLGGVTYSTADTVRPALQLVKQKAGYKSVSSSYIMAKPGHDLLCMGDPAINIKPSSEELAESAIEAARTASIFGIEPKVAMLSYSTLGSGAGEDVDRVREAVKLVKEAAPDLLVDGELQFDAAVDPVVAATKCKDSKVAGQANVFIFPEIQSANIGCKIFQRMAGYELIGPILQGLNAPINDLSRGANTEDVYKMSIITIALS
ncbi:MAG: phosphate acetyltransferase [Eubacterium sp.]|nr:phosphate acetyltransferase [Candidatus Colimonas fimequi]